MNNLSATRRAAARASFAAALLVGVSACGELNVREELGLVGQGPDPFTVVSNRPLEMPADTSELPEPQPGAPSLVQPTPEADAQVALTGAPMPEAETQSAAERALVQGAGADGASDDIRTRLAADAEDEEGWRILDGVFGEDELEEALDPDAEARRLSEAAQQSSNPALILPPEEE